MPNKLKYISLLFAIIVSVYFSLHLYKEPDKIVAENTVQSEKNLQNQAHKQKKTIQQKLKEEKLKAQNKEKSKKAETKIKTKPLFDTDPVVDANVLLNKYTVCIQMLSEKDTINSFLTRYQSNLTEKQRKYFQNTYDYCKKIDQQHPEYQFANYSKLQTQRKQAEATSLWGKIINGKVNPEELSDIEIESLLKQNDPNILLDAPKRLRHYYQKVIHWELEDVLQNHQYDYTNQVQYYAHQLYLCQIGADCSPNATIMTSICFINSDSCGLSFQQFIENILTAGQQADVQLALNHLRRKYN